MTIEINFDFSILLHHLQKVRHTTGYSNSFSALALKVADISRMDLMADYQALLVLGTNHTGSILMVVPDCYLDCS